MTRGQAAALRKCADKGVAINVHFRHRLQDQYKIKINHGIKMEIIRAIETGQCEYVRSQSLNRSTFIVPLFDSIKRLNPNIAIDHITVVYDKARRRLVTAGEMLNVRDEAKRSWQKKE